MVITLSCIKVRPFLYQIIQSSKICLKIILENRAKSKDELDNTLRERKKIKGGGWGGPMYFLKAPQLTHLAINYVK